MNMKSISGGRLHGCAVGAALLAACLLPLTDVQGAASGKKPLSNFAAEKPSCDTRAKPAAQVAANAVEHHVVYHNPTEFAGWPANEGLWSWGDELLVGFEVAAYVPVEDDHSIDRNSHKRVVFARSLDGGKTWKTEEKSEIGSPEYLGDTALFDQSSGDPVAQVLSESIDFAQPDFAMKLRGGSFYISSDRGKTWSKPYRLPSFHNAINESRTSYIVTGPASALFFVTAGVARDGVQYARSYVMQTTDGGKTFAFLSWIGEDIFDQALAENLTTKAKIENVFSIMPSAVQVGKDHFLCALRQRIGKKKWSDIFESVDGGASWQKIAEVESGSTNPVTLVRLDDGVIVAVYGNRRKMPMGVSGKFSRDNGKTWSQEIALRDDARKWDIGYSRAAVRPDGKVVGIYYYTTEQMPENFIGATIWDVRADMQ